MSCLRPLLLAIALTVPYFSPGLIAAASEAPVFRGLGFLSGILNSEARAVSADGTVVVGMSNVNSGLEAFRWTLASGMVGLGDLPGGNF